MKKIIAVSIAVVVLMVGIISLLLIRAGSTPTTQPTQNSPEPKQTSQNQPFNPPIILPSTPTPPPAAKAPTSQSANPVTTPLPNGDNNVRGKTAQISINNFSFNPSYLEVGRDTAIEWTNNDSVAHSIVPDSSNFGSATLQPGKSYDFIASVRGTFNYHCGIHPSMKGTVVVK